VKGNAVFLHKIRYLKKILLLAFVLSPFLSLAQIPNGYYNNATNLTGQQLRIALRNIIRNHTQLSYTPGLWNAYNTTDRKPNGKIWDIYSDIPGGTPSYEYTYFSDQCGANSPSAEGGCYNREHTWPKTYFSSDTPMYTDIFIVMPTDYWVNNKRSDYPYGEVGTATYTSSNGSKLGNNVYPGAPGGTCFEPIDSFKGDIARNYFYVSTCYWADSAHFNNSYAMATQVNLKPWAVQMLLEWHHNDPVSQKEINRNNAAYTVQHNRNPFIDHPEYADCIWGTANCSSMSAINVNMSGSHMNIYPNPTSDDIRINVYVTGENLTLEVLNVSGNVVYKTNEKNSRDAITIPLSSLPAGMYFVRASTTQEVILSKFIRQ